MEPGGCFFLTLGIITNYVHKFIEWFVAESQALTPSRPIGPIIKDHGLEFFAFNI